MVQKIFDWNQLLNPRPLLQGLLLPLKERNYRSSGREVRIGLQPRYRIFVGVFGLRLSLMMMVIFARRLSLMMMVMVMHFFHFRGDSFPRSR